MTIFSLSELDHTVLLETLVSATSTNPSDISANDVGYQLESSLDELKNVLVIPPKNDASRQQVKTGVLEILDASYKLNDQFIEAIIKLSEDLNLDEVVAATLLLQGQQLSDRLDRDVIQSATFLFHRRQLNLLQSLRIIFSAPLDENVDPEIAAVLQRAIEVLTQDRKEGEGSYYGACTKAMSVTRSYLQKLREKDANAIQLGLHTQPGWVEWIEDMHIQLKFLTDQHEALATILFCLAKHKRAALANFKKLLETMGTFEDYSILIAHHLPPIYALITMLCSNDTPLPFSKVIHLHRDLLKMYQESRWPLRYVQAAIILWWVTEFNGLCNDPPASAATEVADVTNTLDYIKDVYQPSKRALKEGAFEYMLALATDVGLVNDLDINRDNLREFLQGQAKQLTESHLLSEEFKKLVIIQFEQFVDSFIANMADILKDLKTKEEEAVLLQQKEVEFDLERFFFIISYIYYGRSDAALTFWNDPESNLYGFLMWASSNLTPLMATVMSYMLASFSFGEQCSAHAHKFLKEEFAPGIARQRRGMHYLSWGSIFQRMENYVTQLGNIRTQGTTGMYRPPPPPPIDATEPLLETTLIIDAHIRLIGRIAQESEEARSWLYENNSFCVLEALFQTLERRTPTQLLASIFYAVSSFLAGKKEEYAKNIWDAIDHWAFGIYPQPTALVVAGPAIPFSGTDIQNLDSIKLSIYPSEAFTRLLVALVKPADDGLLNDKLPFPEDNPRFTHTRPTAIDPYVDFVLRDIFRATLWQVFSRPKEDANALNSASVYMGNTMNMTSVLANGAKKKDQSVAPNPADPQSIIRAHVQLACLQFILACLSSFNEDLILYAERSGIAVDTAIRSSSLKTYASLHPSARVMEHLLSEKCITVLFEIIKHGVVTLNNAPEGSPLADTVLMAIEVLELMSQLQSTYFNIVRPLVQGDERRRKNLQLIGGNTFGSLEEAILYNLDVVVCLGLFTEVGDAAIAAAALRLLERLVVTPTLIQAPEVNYGRPMKRNRILNIMEGHPDSKRVQFGFIHRMETPSEESGVVDLIKMRILGLLNASLDASPSETCVAHFLLGFAISDGTVELSTAQGGIGSGVSLFHTLLDIVMGLDEKPSSVLEYENTKCELKNQCYNVLRRLWKSNLTTSDIMYTLRANKFLVMQWTQQALITPDTLWDGRAFRNDDAFFESQSVNTLCWFLDRRSSLFDYVGLEIRQLASQGASTTVSRYLASLLGTTATDGTLVSNTRLLDLLDFLELEAPEIAGEPSIQWFKGVDFTPAEKSYGSAIIYEPNNVRSLLLLKKRELESKGRLQSGQEESMQNEMEAIIRHLAVESNIRIFKQSRLTCLKAWAQLTEVVLENCEFEQALKTTFLLQMLQAILPKLEAYCTSDVEGAQELSSLSQFIISHISFDSNTFGKGRASDIAHDRLYQLFRVSLRCIQSPLSYAKLRQDFYSISYRYLKGMTDLQEKIGATIGTRYSTQTIKSAGERLLEVVCSDAYAGEGACKNVALLLLDELVALGMQEGNGYVVEALVRNNFLVVLVDTISVLINHLIMSTVDADSALAFLKPSMGFLLRVAQTKAGARHVINARLFTGLKGSRLFEYDPDLGIGRVGDPKAVAKYYELLLWVLRVVTCCILSKGPQNEQTKKLGRQFLEDTKNVALTVFKRHANIRGPKPEAVGGDLRELTDMFVLLMSLTGYIEAREEPAGGIWQN
ncbi:nucleoporin Nup186/Nup192/Nup205 [Tirmania nivea]|nr:nucleoporin Nup186/Nup192/Nup205 [Tirmania nivea]